MRAAAWALMCVSLVVTAGAHLARRLDTRSRNWLITAGLVLLGIGLALGAVSGDL